MTTIVFDVAAFRVSFPEFANATTYPDATLEINWDIATCYISDEDYGYLSTKCRTLALNLMTAHITKLSGLINAGKTPKFVQSSSIDKVSVTVVPPPAGDQFDWWANLTGYGSQLLALLKANIAGGFFVGGRREKSAFRKVGGYF